MTPLADRVDELMNAPVAALAFAVAHEHGLGPDDWADPGSASALAISASDALQPWNGDAVGMRARALADVRPLRGAVQDVLADPRNTWWSAPLDPARQLMVGEPRVAHAPGLQLRPWEIYAQWALGATVTSSLLPADPLVSHAQRALTYGPGDWSPPLPVPRRVVIPDEGARVYEIDSAADWHALAQSYGDPTTHPGRTEDLWSAAGVDNGLCPTWSAVAVDWDAVHLTFAGALTAQYVPVRTGDVVTTLWSWGWEQTMWLRPAWSFGKALPAIVDPSVEAVPRFWSWKD